MIKATDEELEQARSKMYDDREYDDWHYTGPILTIDKLARFSASTRMLEDLIGHIIRIQNSLEENRKNSLESNQKMPSMRTRRLRSRNHWLLRR